MPLPAIVSPRDPDLHRVQRMTPLFVGGKQRALREAGHRAGFTLLQLLLVIVIIVILVSISIPITGMIRKRAESVKCMNQMRNLGAALGVYTTDNGHWPQIPDSMLDDEKKFWKFWLHILEPKPYQIPPEMWLCPTVKREAGITTTEEITYGSYGPTPFDAGRSTPWKFGNQPWLMETGSHHSERKGAHILMSDGSIVEGVGWGPTPAPGGD